ncbi:vp91 capsid [Spodoptera litura granulovirus]|uniref:Vp91 capsid n=1 Tax=Spodoptera litura granulovirus TaxID=359919 RepID=A5IZU4_9BBAC|nr:vp91 capsid [Spodoptera litura granulovirus]ABQ52035.1 vp91 capsid [Spodoptera litura granulovirus]
MVSVSTLLLGAVLVIFLVLFYNFYIIRDFNVNDFDKRIKVFAEYVKNTGERNEIPPYIGYVSDVNEHVYKVTYFNTNDLSVKEHSFHDDREQRFDFAEQKLEDVVLPRNDNSVSTNTYNSFNAHVDDGTVVIPCSEATIFHGKDCKPSDVCTHANTQVPMTEERLNRLVFNKTSARLRTAGVSTSLTHPSLYVRCDADRNPHVEECTNGQIFSNGQCRSYDTMIETNGRYVTKVRKGQVKINSYDVKEEKQDIDLIIPVNDNLSLDVNPCKKYGAGHTYVDNTLSDNQFIECLDDSNIFVHTCMQRYVENGVYSCDKEDVCADFENGTGDMINSVSNEHITYDTGKTSCVKYKIFEVVECDTGNFVATFQLSHPLKLDLTLPKEIYDADIDDCVPYNSSRVTINRDPFKVQVENPYHIDFTHMLFGRVSGIITADSLSDIQNFITYARDLDEIAVNPLNGNSVECADDLTVDLFEGSAFNLCNNGEVIESGAMYDNQYYNVIEKRLDTHELYNKECRIESGQNYLNLSYRTVGDILCYYSSPIKIGENTSLIQSVAS